MHTHSSIFGHTSIEQHAQTHTQHNRHYNEIPLLVIDEDMYFVIPNDVFLNYPYHQNIHFLALTLKTLNSFPGCTTRDPDGVARLAPPTGLSQTSTPPFWN